MDIASTSLPCFWINFINILCSKRETYFTSGWRGISDDSSIAFNSFAIIPVGSTLGTSTTSKITGALGAIELTSLTRPKLA